MKTPICDFARRYAEKDVVRAHMPGHKGKSMLGIEQIDITEFDGADSLYECNGIIAESEANASALFGCDTFYSTEGSSHCIRAMMYLVCLYAASRGEKPIVLAARNCHKSFVSAAAMLDFDVEWIYPDDSDSYLCCKIDTVLLEKRLNEDKKITALYITSPDYLGNVLNIESIADVCRRNEVLLCVDNAHGAYLKFLPESRHPIDLGADICCDSAHKTLPVLTGGAYLHISKSAPALFFEQAKRALSAFGSTSPSYLILQSLDMANSYIDAAYRDDLLALCKSVCDMKERLAEAGYCFVGDETTKLTLDTKKYGYTGHELANLLAKRKIIVEFYDSDYLVMMFTPENADSLPIVEDALINIGKKDAIEREKLAFSLSERVMSIRNASFMPSEELDVHDCEGKVLASENICCPPAVPIVVCGEKIGKDAIRLFEYYGIDRVSVTI